MKNFLLPLFIAVSSFAYGQQVPQQINYQAVARNSVGNVLPNRKITVRLSIHDVNATGTVLYKETRTITTNNFGLFNVGIGSPGADNSTGTINGIDWGSAAKFIQVEVDPDGGSNFINMGAAQLLAVPYALYAGNSGTSTLSGPAGGVLTGTYPNPSIKDSAITNAKVADNAITTSKVVDGSITMAKLGPDVIFGSGGSPSGPASGDLTGSYPNPLINNGVITTTKLADNSVTTSKIVNASVTLAKLAAGVIPTSLPPNGAASGDLTGSYPNPTINNGVITTAKLADNSVTTSKIANASVTLAKLAAGVIPTSLPPSGAASGDLTGSYPNPTINNGVITTTKLADNSVTTSKIVDASVTLAKIAAGVIPTSLPPNGVASGDLSGSYPNPLVSKIQNTAVSNVVPINGQVLKFNGTQWVPATDDVGSGGGSNPTGPAGGDLSGNYPNPNLASGSVTTPKIANGSIVTPKLADDAVNSNKLADNAVITTKIADGSVTAIKLAAGVIPTSLPPNGTAAGDLSGTYPNPTVNKILGVTVNNTGLASGMVLKYNGTQWAPAVDNGGAFSLPYSSSASSTSNLFSVTNTNTGAALEGINTNTTSNISAILGRISTPIAGPMSAGIKGESMGTGNNGIGVYGNHIGNGWGVYGKSIGGYGVYGNSTSGFGVYGKSTSSTGVYGESATGNAGFFSVTDVNNSLDAIYVSNLGLGNGIYSESTSGNGMTAVTNSGSSSAIWGFNNSGGVGIYGVTHAGAGAAIKGASTFDGGTAVEGELINSPASGSLALFKVDGVNKARIDHNGKGFFNGGTQSSGADIAEAFDVEGDRNNYEPGDVLIISQSSDRKVEKSNAAYSTLVAGVYATKPGVLLTEENIQTDIANKVPMGVIGVIPTKVCLEGGAIKRGDLLVTSSTTGVAMKADPDKVKVGQVIGKALEDYSTDGFGKIKVLISIK
jgi:hypothetical protein